MEKEVVGGCKMRRYREEFWHWREGRERRERGEGVKRELEKWRIGRERESG